MEAFTYGTNWNNKIKIIPSDAKANDGFGNPLFLKNNYAFGASPVSTAGKVYAYTLQ